MPGSICSPRTALAVAATAAMLAGCGDDGAGAGGDGGATQPAPAAPAAGTQGTVSVTVSGAVPVTGNGVVTGSGAVSIAAANALRLVDASGTGNGLLHRFAITYDPVSGAVLQVVHAWGSSDTAMSDALTSCVRVVTVVGQVPCGSSVTLDVAAGRVSFAGTALRGDGSFASLLNGDIAFTLR